MGEFWNRYSPLYVIFRQKLRSHHRPYMWYIFGKPWVQGPRCQCYGVSNMQIHKYICQCTQLRNPPMNVKGTRTKVYWGPSEFVFVFVYLYV